jgi:hypothetical protein
MEVDALLHNGCNGAYAASLFPPNEFKEQRICEAGLLLVLSSS